MVSIHASVKDATLSCPFSLVMPKVSIHASVKDATDIHYLVNSQRSVSIHASVKDATMPMMFPIQTKMFQSTHL